MVNSINSLLAANFASLSQTTTSLGVDASTLASWAAAKAGIGANTADIGRDPKAPTKEVWTPGIDPSADSLAARALSGKSFFDPKAKLFADLGASGDYGRLFALYTGVSTLQALVGKATDDSADKSARARAQTEIDRGMAELQQFLATQKFESMRLSPGDRIDDAQTTLAVARTSEDYETAVIAKTSVTSTVSGLDKNAKFDIVALSAGGTERRVAIDLSEMGSIPRSFSNVVSFVNNKLVAAGASSRLAIVDKTPKTSTVTFNGKTTEKPYVGPKLYALKVDVRAGESVSFEPVAPEPALYIVGAASGGARLIKASDVSDAAGQTTWQERPQSTDDPIGAHVATGWYGAGAPYTTRPGEASETRTNTLVSDGSNSFEGALRAPGDATLKLSLADGRQISVSTSWRADDVEAWRALSGESEDVSILNDLSERLTQLLHEQGVAAGVDVWQNGTEAGLSVFSGDGVQVSSLSIGGKNTALEAGDPPTSGLVGGLRDGIYARTFQADTGVATGTDFAGGYTFSLTTDVAHSFTLNAGTASDAATFAADINAQLQAEGVQAAVEFVDNGGEYALQVHGLHDLSAVNFDRGSVKNAGVRIDPGASVAGGLPLSSAGQPFGDAVRTYSLSGGAPLLSETGALDVSVVLETPTGDKIINVSVSATERANDPDVSPGHWAQVFQDRLQDAFNDAGVYAGAFSDDLTQWGVAENSSARLKSVTVNGNAQGFSADAPSFGLGGAFSVERSFTSAQTATGVADDVPTLLSDQNVSITFDTVWGQKTVSAVLQSGDARTLESAALRLNEALSAEGYDLGVEATDLSGGGAGLRLVTGASRTLHSDVSVNLGGLEVSTSLDPIDSQSHADDLSGAARVADRAARGAAITEVKPTLSTFIPPSVNPSGWFAGRAFDVAVGGDLKSASARAVAAAPDGSVYVLANIAGSSDTLPIKGASDVALLKYDSAGNLQRTRILGAADAATGFTLAVSSDGKVAVAGGVTGALAGGGAASGDVDSFVSVFNSDGDTLWTARRASTGDDEVHAIAFAPDGGVVVVGVTKGALGANVALGGADGYVRSYNANGIENFTRQFGTSGADGVSALAVKDNGAGGIDIYTGGVENFRGVLRSFSYVSNTGVTIGATRDIGFFYEGAINTLAVDGNALYVGGQIGADRLNVANTARPSVAGRDGFVARVDADLSSSALDRTTYVGASGTDNVSNISIVSGAVYAVGTEEGVLAGQGGKGTSAFITRVGDDGALDWTRTFSSIAGGFSPAGLSIAANGASALDALRLPTGRVNAVNSAHLIDNSALKAGDEFKVGGFGERLSTVSVLKTDTMSSLLAKLNRALGGNGRAEIVRGDDGDRIKITSSAGKAVVIDHGRDGHDALGGLGLQAGTIAVNADTRGAKHTYGLGLNPQDIKLDTKANIAKTKAELSAAISIIRQAYESLANPNAKPQTAEEKALEARKAAAGAAPAYYTAQLANYKAALARLGG